MAGPAPGDMRDRNGLRLCGRRRAYTDFLVLCKLWRASRLQVPVSGIINTGEYPIA